MPTKSKTTKTPDQVRAELSEAGLSLAEWARAHNLSYDVARGVLTGRIKATRGQAHRIAVALGLKQGRVLPAHMFAPPPRTAGPKLRVVKASS